MMKIKTYKYYLAIAVISFCLSCSDEFAQEDPPFLVNSDSFFLSEEDYNNALIGIYDLLQATYTNVILGEIASDNTHAGGESATDVIGWQQVDRMQHTPVNDNLDDIWDFNFAGVQRASFMIENEDNIDFEGKAQILAEARFLRAYFNFELVKWFGGIPIKPEGQFLLGEELTIPRSSVEEVYIYIESDLQFAIDNLALQPVALGRVSLGSAQALLGKVLLYQDKFSESAAQLQNVIDSGLYRLYGTVEGEDYADFWENDVENTVESVFEIQYASVQGAGFDCLQCSEGNVAVGFSGVRGYSGPVFVSGFGFNLPTQQVYDAYLADDIRRDISILNIEEWANETGASFTVGNQDPITGQTGFYNRKYLPRMVEEQPGDTNLTHPNNYRAIRYADVLLMAAEAYNRGGSNDELARIYLNQVRARAGLQDVSSSGSQLLEDIYRDRRLELIGEGHRFFDLVRTDRAAQNIEGFQAPKHNVFPIPFEEIQFSQGNWDQNPEY